MCACSTLAASLPTVLAPADRDGGVQVQAGTDEDDGQGERAAPRGGEQTRLRPKSGSRGVTLRSSELNIRSAESEVDVRGMSAEEASL